MLLEETTLLEDDTITDELDEDWTDDDNEEDETTDELDDEITDDEVIADELLTATLLRELDTTTCELLPPTTPQGAGWEVQVEREIQLLLLS